ncbi:uncharacterized protein LOC100572895 [Acyrthosiphon pisum]|uniref:Uncharacterized protein n=1 Tax=Acyrthosiphon pisum TaxID=7029 RepID=A0A8R2AEK2_ACYPI|nr:uncharacterized protein LOC100572895 [Acyrthosiphon pisum]|eukprot:XP_003245788.1 PREDICTED: uncharacterized protein LOC100572895 [Acyrthosiphon pisum]
MFLSSLMVVLATLVLFNQAANIENIIDFSNIIHSEDLTSPPSKIELFRPNGIEKTGEGNYGNNSTSKINNNSILKKFTSGISGYLNSYFNSSCETSNIIPADDEVCLCKNSTMLFFLKKKNCFWVKVSNISKKKPDSH